MGLLNESYEALDDWATDWLFEEAGCGHSLPEGALEATEGSIRRLVDEAVECAEEAFKQHIEKSPLSAEVIETLGKAGM